MATPIPANDVELSLNDVVHATGAALRAGSAGVMRGITTDTRGDVRGKLFVAIEGENFDGHAFVADAVNAGAAGVVVSRDMEVPGDVSVLRVESSLVALGALARFHRHRWGGTLVAVAGSAGKTTTRSAIGAALEAIAPGAVHQSRGNLNNLVGVPMVLFGLGSSHRFAVVEIGTNARGEVGKLAAIASPDVGVLTLVAIEHSAGIGDLDAIEAEEGDLFAALGAAGTAVGNLDDARIERLMAKSPTGTRRTYGTHADADYRVASRAPFGLGGVSVTLERPVGEDREIIRLDAPLVGLPGALAVAAAVAVADRLADAPLDPERVQAAFERVGVGEPGRLNPAELADGSVIIDDSYNANPASVLAATAAAREIADGRGVRLGLVIGEMRELGSLSVSEHEALGRALADCGASYLIAIGGDAEHLADRAREKGLDATFVPDTARALALTLERIRSGDVVLVKASRGIGAERVVEGVVAMKGRAR